MSGRIVLLRVFPVLLAAPLPAAEPPGVTGKVLDPEGKPAAAATVYLIQQNPATGEAGAFRRVQTTPEGAFVFPPLPAEKDPSRLGVLAVNEGFGAWGTARDPKARRTDLQIRP